MLELSERMAAVENAPERLIRRLANDDAIEISGPVLARSDRLGERTWSQSPAPRARRISRRSRAAPSSAKQVTDVLVERGDMAVARKVAANGCALLRRLAAQPGRPRERRRRSRQRGRAAARAVRPRCSATARARDRYGAQAAARHRAARRPRRSINRILAEVSQKVESATVAEARLRGGASEIVMAMRRSRAASRAANLMQFAKALKARGDRRHAVAADRRLGRVIDRFLDDPSDDPIMILCKAIDLDWPAALAVLGAGSESKKCAKAAPRRQQESTASCRSIRRSA